MPKATITNDEKLKAIENLQTLIAGFFEQNIRQETAGTLAEMERFYKQLETRKQRLLNPQPTASKPKAQVSGADKVVMQWQDGDVLRTESYVNSKPKAGRTGRGNG